MSAPHPSRWRRAVTAVAVTAMAGTAATVVAATPAQAEVSRGVTIPAFYDPPTTLPARNGTIVRSQPVTLGLSFDLPGMSGPLPGKATLLMYKSTDTAGNPVAVTGTYIEPSAKWSGAGARPLVSIAEGTQGQGDQCAPSLSLQHPATITDQTVSVGYEALSVYSWLSKGVAVVVTDYVGLGTTDRLHTYVNRVDEGHAVLDAVRAAKNLPGTSLTRTSKVGLYGYSQGGGASASAAELARSYAPDVAVVGAYAGAPPADLAATLATIDGTALVAAVGWAVNGFVQTYPALRAVLQANTNAAGRAALADLSTACIGDGLGAYAFRKSSEWTTSGKSLSSIIAATPVAKSALDAQRIGTMKPSAPVRIATGTQDDFVPHAQAKALAADWCAQGASVTYAPIVQNVPTFGTGANHIGPFLQDSADAQQWLVDRFTGKPATSSCATLASMP